MGMCRQAFWLAGMTKRAHFFRMSQWFKDSEIYSVQGKAICPCTDFHLPKKKRMKQSCLDTESCLCTNSLWRYHCFSRPVNSWLSLIAAGLRVEVKHHRVPAQTEGSCGDNTSSGNPCPHYKVTDRCSLHCMGHQGSIIKHHKDLPELKTTLSSLPQSQPLSWLVSQAHFFKELRLNKQE